MECECVCRSCVRSHETAQWQEVVEEGEDWALLLLLWLAGLDSTSHQTHTECFSITLVFNDQFRTHQNNWNTCQRANKDNLSATNADWLSWKSTWRSIISELDTSELKVNNGTPTRCQLHIRQKFFLPVSSELPLGPIHTFLRYGCCSERRGRQSEWMGLAKT